MIDHVVEWLPKEVDRVVLAVNYMADSIREHLRQAELGVEVTVVEEEEPLGTGGAFRNALQEVTEDLFIGLNGDIISSLDLSAMIKAQRRHGGIGTIALWHVEDPSRFGVVELDDDQRILSFVEKPQPGTAPSKLINAGAYVLRREILELVEPGEPTSIEREIFPLVLGQGLFGHRFTGFWVDAGTPEAYLEAHQELLYHREGGREPHPGLDTTVKLRHPCLMDPDVRVGARAEVGPYVTMGPGCRVGPGATLVNCVLLPGVIVGEGATLTDCILGEAAEVEEGEVLEGQVLADGRSPELVP